TRIDADSGNSIVVPESQTVYTLTSQPSNGTVQQFVGGSWKDIPINGQFNQADISAGHIRFVNDGSENHTASFGYTVSDGTPNSYSDNFLVDVTPVNNRPAASGGAVYVDEGEGN